MDTVLLLKALLLGLVEGLTEFLPISSTGHLIIVGELLDFNNEKGKVFEIVIQLGAILAVCWAYRERLIRVAAGLRRDPLAQRFVLNVLVAFLPAVVLGLIFHKTIKQLLFNPITVALALMIGGLVILWVEHRPQAPRVVDLDVLSGKDALKIGLLQTLAMIPGTSRAAATIIGGMWIGLDRKTATQFSFFLAIPTMLGATTLDVYKNRALLEWADLPMFAIGFLAAFASGLLAVRLLLRYVSNHSFVAFAWYRLVFGALVLAYFWNKPL